MLADTVYGIRGEGSDSSTSLGRLRTYVRSEREGDRQVPDQKTLHVESLLAQAHRRLWMAQQEAESMSQLGLSEDLWSLMLEVERLQVALLRGRPRATTGRQVHP